MQNSHRLTEEDARIFAESIVETIRESLLVLDDNLNVVSANPAFYRQFRVERAQTEGASVYDLGNKQWDIPRLRELMEKIIPDNEKVENFEVEHDFPDIGHRIMLLNGRKIHQQGDRRNLILLAIEDITDRVETRRALERSEARYHRLVEEINSIIIEIDTNGEILFLNQFAEKLFGYAREEVVGKQLVGTILPEKDDYGTDHTELVADLIQNTENFYFNESQGVSKTGKAVYFSWSGRLIDGQETDEQSILIDGNDTTEVQEARRQARISHHVLNATGYPIFLLDDHKHLLLVNRAFAELAGNSVAEMEGSHLSDSRLPETLMDVLEAAVEAAFCDHDHQVTEVEYEQGYFQIRVEPQLENGRMTQALVFFNDITKRKQAEAQLKQLNSELDRRVSDRTAEADARTKQLQSLGEQLIEAEENERRRIADLLHGDLQQILAATKMQLQDISERLPRGQRLVYVLEMIDASIEKARQISHDLSPAVLQHPDLSTAMIWMSEQMRNQFGLQVKFQRTDAQLIESMHLRRFVFRAVQELLFNVVKHAGVKKAQIDYFKSNGWFKIRLTDHGRGFNPDSLPSSPKEDGLGLQSIRERAIFFGGKLDIESAPGQGSRFTLSIPCETDETDEPRMQPKGTQPVPESTIRVILADDHKIMRQGLKHLINRQSETEVVAEAANGREALEMAHQLQPDVVVMDISMPKMDGIEATQRITAELPDICVVGLTMHDEKYLRQAMLNAGAQTIISKTGSLGKLLEAIKKER